MNRLVAKKVDGSVVGNYLENFTKNFHSVAKPKC